MKGTLILLVVMFGAGLGLGYLLGNSQDTITRAEPARSATRPAPGADDLVVPEGGYRSLGDAIGTVPALRGETGHGIITGKVTNEEGDPIAGAVIRASQRFASSFHGSSPPRGSRARIGGRLSRGTELFSMASLTFAGSRFNHRS